MKQFILVHKANSFVYYQPDKSWSYINLNPIFVTDMIGWSYIISNPIIMIYVIVVVLVNVVHVTLISFFVILLKTA